LKNLDILTAGMNRKRGLSTTLWNDNSYKELKVKALEKEMEEKELKMELIRCQIEESRQRAQAERERASFFSRASLSLNRGSELQIRSPVEGVRVINFTIGTACYAIKRPLLLLSELCQGKQKKEPKFNIQKKCKIAK